MIVSNKYNYCLSQKLCAVTNTVIMGIRVWVHQVKDKQYINIEQNFKIPAISIHTTPTWPHDGHST